VITVSAAEPGDAAAIAALLADLGRFYGTAGQVDAVQVDAVQVDAGQVAEAIFSTPPTAYALLARDAGQLAGLAAYSFLWPAAGASRSLFLKELYVPEAYRGRGVGRLLMNAVLQTATALRCSRVEWTTDPDNAAAQAFYARLGLPAHPKIFYRVTLAGDQNGEIGSLSRLFRHSQEIQNNGWPATRIPSGETHVNVLNETST
jgi:GNAT superfamily N-acetyltransferase